MKSIFRMIHVGLCNSFMHWRNSSTNHDSAAFLIMFGSTMYIWAVATVLLFIVDVPVPTAGKVSYLLPVLSFFAALIISYITFKRPYNYRRTLKRYREMSRISKFTINALSLVYVFFSPAFYISFALAVSGK